MPWDDNSYTFNFLYIFLLQDFCKPVINSTLPHSKIIMQTIQQQLLFEPVASNMKHICFLSLLISWEELQTFHIALLGFNSQHFSKCICQIRLFDDYKFKVC